MLPGEHCRFYCSSSQNNLIKGKTFFWFVPKIIDLKSLLKSALAGKETFLLEVVQASF